MYIGQSKMYTSKTTLILCMMLIKGTILQFIALFSMGWNIETDKYDQATTYQGLWFYKFCNGQGNCKTRSYYEDYKDVHYSAVHYSKYVGPQVKAVLSCLFCLLSTVLSCLIYRNHAYGLRICMLNVCLLLISGTLIWTEIGSRSAEIAARVSASNTHHDVKFPYSLFLSALGSSVTVLIGLIYFFALWKNNFGSGEMCNQYIDSDSVLM